MISVKINWFPDATLAPPCNNSRGVRRRKPGTWFRATLTFIDAQKRPDWWSEITETTPQEPSAISGAETGDARGRGLQNAAGFRHRRPESRHTGSVR